MNAEHLFFAQFIIEQKKISDGINVALTKVRRQSHTAFKVQCAKFTKSWKTRLLCFRGRYQVYLHTGKSLCMKL